MSNVRFPLLIAAFFLLNQLLSAAGNDDILLFPITFYSKAGNRNSASVTCTAQYFRVGKSCYLLSAGHCAREPYSNPVIHFASLNESLQIKERYSEIDTVSLVVPQTISVFCGGLTDISKSIYQRPEPLKERTKQLNSFRAQGFVSGKLHTEYTQGADWHSGAFGYADIETIFTGHAEWFFLHNLQAFPGMSGGAVTNMSGEAVGMQVRTVPFQDNSTLVPYALIIPRLQGKDSKKYIWDEIKNKSEAKSYSESLQKINQIVDAARMSSMIYTSDNIYISTGDNVGKGTGDNAGKGTGDNAGKGTGDNAGKGTDGNALNEEIVALKQNPDYVLNLIQEPDEGIADPSSPGSRLVGVGPFQIDGQDDYLKYSALIPYLGKKTIGKNDPFMPDEKTRKAILKRLDGFYRPIYRLEGSSHLIYRADAASPMGWKIFVNSSSIIHIDVNPKKNEIALDIALHFLMSRENRLGSPTIPVQGKKTFKVFADKDMKVITLQEFDGTFWDCPNKHYLKLICRPRDSKVKGILSLSKNQEGRGLLSFRYARFLDVEKEKMLEYYYGKIDAVDEKYWRN